MAMKNKLKTFCRKLFLRSTVSTAFSVGVSFTHPYSYRRPSELARKVLKNCPCGLIHDEDSGLQSDTFELMEAKLADDGVDLLPFPSYHMSVEMALKPYDRERIQRVIAATTDLSPEHLKLTVQAWIAALVGLANYILHEHEKNDYDYATIYAKVIEPLVQDDALRKRVRSMSEEELLKISMDNIGDVYQNRNALEAYRTAKQALFSSDFYRIAMDVINLGHEAFRVLDENPVQSLLLTLEMSSALNRLNLEQFRRVVEIGTRTSSGLREGRTKAHRGNAADVDDRHFEWQKAINQVMSNDKSVSFRKASQMVAKEFGFSDRNIRRYTKSSKKQKV